MPVGPNPGLQPAVQQGIQGGPVPLLSQVSPQAPMRQQVPQPMNPSSASSMQTPVDQTQMQTNQSETEMIIRALAERLKFNTQVAKQQQSQTQTAIGGGKDYSYASGGGMNYGVGGGNRISNFSHSEVSPIPKMYQNRMY